MIPIIENTPEERDLKVSLFNNYYIKYVRIGFEVMHALLAIIILYPTSVLLSRVL